MKLTKRIYTPCNYTITNDISVIEVDTSAGGIANIYLQPINFNFKFDTVFINDISDNASVGNIILHTTGSDLINSSSFLVLDSDGITAELLVSNKNEYLANLSTDGESSGASGPAGGDLSGLYPNPSVLFPNGYPTYDLRYLQIGAGAGGDLLGSLPSPTVNWANGYGIYNLKYIQIGATAGGDLSGTLPNASVTWSNGYATYDARYIKTTEKGIANGVVPLNGTTKIDAIYLPSYVDDVIEVPNYASLPLVGETGKIYITLDTNNQYRWTGSAYIQITNSSAVWGNISGIITNQLDLVSYVNTQISNSLTGYAKLDGTNQPFTGNLAIKKSNNLWDFKFTNSLNVDTFSINNQFGTDNFNIWAYGSAGFGNPSNATFDLGVPSTSTGLYGERFIINDAINNGGGIDLIVSRFNVSDNQNRTAKFYVNPKTGDTANIIGNTSDNTTKALSVKDSSTIEYFYLKNDKSLYHGGNALIQSSWNGTPNLTINGNASSQANITINNANDSVLDMYASNTIYQRFYIGGVNMSEIIVGSGGSSLRAISSTGSASNLTVGSVFSGHYTAYSQGGGYEMWAKFRAVFVDANASQTRTTFTPTDGNWNFTGTAQNLLTVANGIKIANNTDSYDVAGEGSIKYVSNTLQYASASAWLTVATTNDLSGYAKLDGTNTPFTGDITITRSTASTSFLVESTFASNPTIFITAKGYNPSFRLMNSAGTNVGTLNYNPTNTRFILNSNNASLVQVLYNLARGISVGASNTAIDSNIFLLKNESGTTKITFNTNTGDTATIKGNTSDNTTKSLSITDSASSEYFYLRNDKTLLFNGLSATIQGTSQNALTVNNGIKIGNNTDLFNIAGGGSLKYASDFFYGCTSTEWTKLVTQNFDSSLRVGAITTVTTNTTLDTTHYVVLVDCTAGAVTVTLPTAVGNSKLTYTIKKIDSSANIVTIATTSSQLIDGATTQTISAQYISKTVKTNATAWYFI